MRISDWSSDVCSSDLLVWSRFEDSVHDAMRAPAMARMRAALTPDKTIAAWEALIAAPDYRTAFVRALLPGVSLDKGANDDSIEGTIPPYDIPRLKVADSHSDTGLEPGGCGRGRATA